MKYTTRVLTGLLVISVGASLTGNFQSLLSLALMSIMCTLGIALVVWIPLLYVIGLIALACVSGIRAMVAMFSETERKEEGAPEQKGTLLKERMAIEQYIDRAKFYGLSHEQILSALKNGGWSDAEIQAAYGGHQRP